MPSLAAEQNPRPTQRNISRAQVAEAIEALETTGQAATYTAVRQTLGNRGSMQTIAKYIREYRAEEQKEQITTGQTRGPPLPDVITRGLILSAERHWALVTEAASEIVAQQRHRSAQKLLLGRQHTREAQLRANEAEQARADTAARLAESETLAAKLQADLDALRTEHDERGRNLHTLTERHHAQTTVLEEKSERLADATRSLTRITEELEQRVAENRSLQHQNQTQHQTLDTRTQALMEHREKETQRQRQSETAIARLEQQLHALTQERDDLLARLTRTQHALDDTRATLAERERAATLYEERATAAQNSTETAYSTMRELSETLRAMNLQLQAKETTIHELEQLLTPAARATYLAP